MIIDCIADLHGHYPTLEGGDLLIVGGDWCANDSEENLRRFEGWLLSQGSSQYKKIIVIAGNHDNTAYEFRQFALTPYLQALPNVKYLSDSGTEFTIEEDDIELENSGFHPTIERTFKIWGSPWTKTFEGMNPKCKAFTVDTEEELQEKWKMIPYDVDILITHSPPYGILDGIPNKYDGTLFAVGSKSLFGFLKYAIRPKLHVFGHIHEGFGQTEFFNGYNDVMIKSVNASYVNEKYQPVNKPIRIEL